MCAAAAGSPTQGWVGPAPCPAAFEVVSIAEEAMRSELSRVLRPIRQEPPHRRFLPVPATAVAPGLYPNEPENCRRSLAEILPVLSHLCLIVLVTWVYRLEGRSLLIIMQT